MNHSQFTSCVRMIAGILFVVSFAVTASAQSADGSSVLTFSAPVRLPGITLAAGTYLFQRVESNRDMRSVQVFSVKPQRLVATLTTSPITRASGTDHVIFRETPQGVTPVVGALYLRGGATGAEFIYSGRERQQLAATRSVAAVPTVPTPAVTVTR